MKHSKPSTTSNVGRKVVAGFIWSTSEIWGSQLIQLLVFLVLARLLAPSSFGLAALATVFLTLSSLLTAQGLPDALVQKRELRQEQTSTVFWLTLVFAALFASILLGLAGQVSTLLGQPAFAPVLRCSTPIIVLDALSSLQEAQFRRELRFRPLAVRRTFANLIGGLFGIAAAFAGAGVYALIGAQAISSLAGLILLWKQSLWRPSFVFSFSSLKELLPYSTQTFGSSLLALVNRRSDDLIVGSVLGSVALGYYAVAYRVLLLLNNTVTKVISRVAFPVFSRLQHEPQRLLHAFRRTTHAASLLGVPVFTGLALMAHIIIPVLFGSKWRGSIPSMQVLAFVGLLQNVILFNNNVCRAVGKPGYNTIFQGVNVIANVAGFLFFVRHGILAVAIVLLVNTILLSPLSFAFVRKLIGLDLFSYLRQFRGPVLSAALAGLVLAALGRLWPFPQETFLFLTASLATFVLTYAGSLLLFDRKFVMELLRFGSSSLPDRLKERRFALLLNQFLQPREN